MRLLHHLQISDRELRKKIRRREVLMAGNFKLKIYGKLGCKSGKRMKKENRVFFSSAAEALQFGFRPCAHCLKNDYIKWKNGLI